jgi:hypothetical protein
MNRLVVADGKTELERIQEHISRLREIIRHYHNEASRAEIDRRYSDEQKSLYQALYWRMRREYSLNPTQSAKLCITQYREQYHYHKGVVDDMILARDRWLAEAEAETAKLRRWRIKRRDWLATEAGARELAELRARRVQERRRREWEEYARQQDLARQELLRQKEYAYAWPHDDYAAHGAGLEHYPRDERLYERYPYARRHDEYAGMPGGPAWRV